MVTVQSEDSGIVWETASSRCSTPWASEASSPSDTYSLEGSGTQGNIVIIMDEDKIKRRKRTSSKGKFGDRFRRPGSRSSGTAIGEERPAMIEVSVPNIKPENSEDGQSVEDKSDKDQELFNLISEGFEILNIVVPSKLPTVDEENSSELTDNLSYLDDTPRIKTKSKQKENPAILIDHDNISIEIQEVKDESPSQAPSEGEPKKEETDMDYLEKFTLLDQHVPGSQSEELEVMEAVQPEEPLVPHDKHKVNGTIDLDSFVVVSEAEATSDHLDEVFYGASGNAEAELPCNHKNDKELTNGSIKTLKVCGTTLFDSQETILTPIFLPSGPPKIIDQDLLDEPRAMSFHYLDLYEEAVGDRKRDDDFSDRESVVSEKSFKRRFSDSDDGDGYLEKFILKDDTPVVEDVPQVEVIDSDRVIWPQNKFEMTGCLIHVPEDSEPEVENVDRLDSQSETKAQTQSPGSLKDAEDSDELKTSCETVQNVSEALENIDGSDAKTECSGIDIVSHEQSQKHVEMFESVNQETHVLIEEGTQSEVNESKCVDSTDVKQTEMAVPNLSQENVKIEMTSRPIQNGLTEKHEDFESFAKIKENIITSNEEMLNNERIDILTQDLVKKKDVEDMPTLTNKADETKIAYSEEISQQELSVKDECAILAEPNKAQPLSEKEIVSVPKFPKQDTKALQENTSELIRIQDIPADFGKVVRETVDQTVVLKHENQKQVELDIKEQVIAEIKDTNLGAQMQNQLATFSEPKAFEGLTETSEKNKELSTEETELNVTPLAIDRVQSVQTVTADKLDTLDFISGSPSQDGAVAQVPTPEKTDFDHEVGKVGKGFGLNEEIPLRQHSEENAVIITPTKEELFKATVPQTFLKEEELTEEDSGLRREAKNCEPEEKVDKVFEQVYPVTSAEVLKMPSDCLEGKNEDTSANVLLKDTQEESIWRTLETRTPSPPEDTMRVSPLELIESTPEDDSFVEDERIERKRSLLSTLRSYSAQENLSGLDHDAAEPDSQKELSYDLGFELVSEQDIMQLEAETAQGKRQKQGQDQSIESTTEADYEFIEEWDGAHDSELDQLKEDGEPMDAFCTDCQCPILKSNGGHENHAVSTLDKAFERIKVNFTTHIYQLTHFLISVSLVS